MQGIMAISIRDRTIWKSQKIFISQIHFPVNSVADESPVTTKPRLIHLGTLVTFSALATS